MTVTIYTFNIYIYLMNVNTHTGARAHTHTSTMLYQFTPFAYSSWFTDTLCSQNELKISVLPHPPKCWPCRFVPPHLLSLLPLLLSFSFVVFSIPILSEFKFLFNHLLLPCLAQNLNKFSSFILCRSWLKPVPTQFSAYSM